VAGVTRGEQFTIEKIYGEHTKNSILPISKMKIYLGAFKKTSKKAGKLI
jgi:hypothetical protein